MDEFAATIEALEHQWMRAWMNRDRNTMKALAQRDFVFLLGSKSSAILDRASWLEAATPRFACLSYRFHEIYVRRHGRIAMFAARVTIESRIGAHDWSGDLWVADLWQRGRMRRRWKLVERTVSRPDSDTRLPDEIRAMQLWR